MVNDLLTIQRGIANGNELMLEELYKLFHKKLMHFSRVITRSDEIAEEVVDDVFVNQDLIGSKVYKGQDFLGIVSDYFETPANPVIEVSKEDGSNFLIPYVDSVFEKIDPENKILILNSDFGIDDDED